LYLKIISLKKIDDLKYFVFIIFNFVFAFGIAMQAIIDPNAEPSLMVFVSIFNISYWAVYGEISILDSLNECLSNGKCEEIGSMLFAYSLLMIYMIISSVLLINLLIAMFRYLH
jgi:hypothetical protein